MKKWYAILTIALLVLICGATNRAQAPSGNPNANANANANPSPQTPTPSDAVIDRIIERENALIKAFANYSPLVETYIQNLQPDQTLNKAPKSDKYFLGKLDLTNGVMGKTLMPNAGFGSAFKNAFTQLYSMRYLADGFAQLILVDGKTFDREHYEFTPVGREFLGDVRCLLFDVQPKRRAGDGKFFGRIWVEEKDLT